MLLISPLHKLLANEPMKPALCLAILCELPAALDLARVADEGCGFVDGGLARRHEVLSDERAELWVAGEHAGELEDVHRMRPKNS